MEDNKNFKELLNRVLRDGGESSDIYFEKREDFRISLSSDSKVLPIYGFSEGISLRLFKNGFCGSIHLESPREEELYKAADALRISSQVNSGILSIKGGAKREVKNNVSFNAKNKRLKGCNLGPVDNQSSFKKDTADIPLKIEEIGHFLKDYSQNKLIYSINASFYCQEVKIYDSKENWVNDLREGCLLQVKTSLSKDSFQVLSEIHLEFSNIRDFKEKINPHEIAKVAIQKSIEKKDSVKAPNGEMSVVLANGSGGVFIHEAVAHLFEADNPIISSCYEEVKRYRFGEKISIFDDPSLMIRGRYQYDDEGIIGRRKGLIIQGKWAGLIHNVRTAHHKRADPGGNGRRQSFRDIPLPRTSAIYIENGEMSSEEVVRSVKFGIYASGFGESIFEESNGDFSINVSEGNLIRNGKISEPISGVLMTGNSFEVLRAIDLVANDLKFDSTGLSCTKAGQTIPSSVGTPTMRIELIRVIPQ